MNKLLSTLVLAVSAAFTLNVQAASHAGAAPAKASEPAKAGDKKEMKKEDKKDEKKDMAKPADKGASAPK
jgi:ribosomal protein L12E/L44/L45/RPP1/RPP2